MTFAVAFWSQELTPGKEEVIVPVSDLKISNVALGDTLVDPNGRSTIKIAYNPPGSSDDEDEENEDSKETVTTVLCSLTAGKFEHTATDIVLEEDQPYIFTLVGKNTVFLSGNYLEREGVDIPPFDQSHLLDSEDEEEFGSDLDMGIDELTDTSRFEEAAEELPKNLKRARESDSNVADKEKPKADKRNKKLKAGNGQAIVTDAEGKEAEKKEEKKSDNKDGKKGEQREKKKDKKEKKEKSGEEVKPKPAEKELPGGLKVLDAAVGNGPAAKKGNTISMRYIGKLQNGKVFDKNVKGKPFTFRLGQGEVIKGWDEGIVGMHVGGERVLTIPSHMAYGKKGTGDIPPNSTLIFEVKLLEIK